MDDCKIERRFEVAVAKFKRELARQGMYSECAGQVRHYDLRRMDADNVIRSLEGALVRCHNTPSVYIELKKGFRCNAKSMVERGNGDACIAGDYVGLVGDVLLVAVDIWSDNAVEIVLRGIPLWVILEIGVVYEAAHELAAA